MSTGQSDHEIAIALEEAAERLRQDRESFDQRRSHDAKWFNMKLRMGWTAVYMLPLILIFCGIVVLNHSDYPTFAVAAASGSLLVDVLAIVGSAWKLVLSGGAPTQIEPVIQRGPSRPR